MAPGDLRPLQPRPTAPLTIVLLGNQSSIHVQRWAQALASRGHAIVPVDLRGQRRAPARRVLDFLTLRREVAAGLRRPRAVLAVHFAPDGILATGLRGLHPVVVSVWGRDVTGVRPGARGHLRAAQLGAFLRAADARTATSRFLQETVRRRFGAESVVVPFGVDAARFSPPGAPRSDGPVRLAFVKWLSPKYGPDVLLGALARLGDVPAWEAVLAGDGPLLDALREEATRTGLAGRVHFAGRLAHEAVADVLRASDLFVMPSREEEFGVAAVEAAATGLPVVASRVGGIPEVVDDGESGLLVPADDPDALADALRRLLLDRDLRASMGAAGRRLVVERYAWETCVDRMEAVYASVVERGAARSSQ